MDELRCHYCFSDTPRGPVVGWLVELRDHGNWERPVCEWHALSRHASTYPGDLVVLRLIGQPEIPQKSEPCGAHAITEWIEGTPRALSWCARTAGPCPFVGAQTQRAVNDRRIELGWLRDEDVPDLERPCAAQQAKAYRGQLDALRKGET